MYVFLDYIYLSVYTFIHMLYDVKGGKDSWHGYYTEKIVIFYVPGQVAIFVTEKKRMLSIFIYD